MGMSCASYQDRPLQLFRFHCLIQRVKQQVHLFSQFSCRVQAVTAHQCLHLVALGTHLQAPVLNRLSHRLVEIFFSVLRTEVNALVAVHGCTSSDLEQQFSLFILF